MRARCTSTSATPAARGTEITEELPESRTRTALFGRVRKSLGEGSAVELGGRFYSDDWGITSFTLEPRYYRTLSEDWDMRLRYRFYDQTAADDFAPSFTTAPEFRTPSRVTQMPSIASRPSAARGRR